MNKDKVLEKIKNPYASTFLVWLACVIAFMATKSGFVAAFTIFYTGLLPFLYIILWFSKSTVGQKLRENAKKWHVAVGVSWFAFAYAIYAQKWAANIINEVFKVDASNLSITYAVMAFLFTPFGMLYQETLASGLWNALILIGILWGGIIPLVLVLPIPMKKVAKIIAGSFIIILSSSFFISTALNLALNKEFMVQQFALWADFNTNHMCTNAWSAKAKGVLFLGGDRVLVYQPSSPIGSQFSAETCNYAKRF